MKLPIKGYIKDYWYLFIFILLGVFFRLFGLGVNYFGGDELSTIDYLISTNKSLPSVSDFISFLAVQDRGPGQYLINYINILIFGFRNEFQLRFPYFLFSIGSIFTVYLLTKYIFKHTLNAVFSAYLIAFNGLFIIFGRVSQYQSLLTLLIPLSIYYYYRGFEENKTKFVVISAIIYSLCLISHFDSMSVIVLFVTYFISLLFKNFRFTLKSEHIRKFIIFILTIVLVCGSVYLPYLFSDQRSTANYIGGRIFGRYFLYPNNTYEKLGKILELYMPLESWVIVLILCFIGLASYAIFLPKKKIRILFNKLIDFEFVYLIILSVAFLLFVATSLSIMGRLGSLLIFINLSLVCLFLIFSNKLNPKITSISVWFITSFFAYFYLFSDPRTHIYISFIPGFIIASSGFRYLKELKLTRLYAYIFLFVFIIFSVFNTYFYYLVYIDKNPEYLWNAKRFLYKDLPVVSRSNNTGLKLFAFTTNNHFSEIKELFDKNCLIGTYASNEKWETTSFYLDRPQISLNIRDLPNGPDNIVYFVSPNIWNSLTLNRANSFIEYKLLKTYYTYSKPTVYIFGKLNTYSNYSNPCGL